MERNKLVERESRRRRRNEEIKPKLYLLYVIVILTADIGKKKRISHFLPTRF